MINRYLYNQHNQNIKNQGGVHSWSADVDSEIYQNIESVEVLANSNQQQITSTQQSVNNIINNELPNKQNQINSINSDLQNKQAQINNHEERLGNQQIKIDNFDLVISKLDEKSLEYLGKYYEEVATGKVIEGLVVKDGLVSEKRFWLNLSYFIFAGLTFFNIGVVLSVMFVERIVKADMYYLIPIDLVLFTFMYFVISQYTYYKKIYMEYINRSVVAKTYLSILKGNNNQEERNIITKIVADTLFSRNVTDQGNDLPLKDMLRFGEKVVDMRK